MISRQTRNFWTSNKGWKEYNTFNIIYLDKPEMNKDFFKGFCVFSHRKNIMNVSRGLLGYLHKVKPFKDDFAVTKKLQNINKSFKYVRNLKKIVDFDIEAAKF